MAEPKQRYANQQSSEPVAGDQPSGTVSRADTTRLPSDTSKAGELTLTPMQTEHVAPVSEWLAEEANYKWLDFGHGTQKLSPPALKMMSQRGIHALRVVSIDDVPVGLVALSDINSQFETATLWYVLGDKRFEGRGVTSRAVAAMLVEGFVQLGLRAISAWAVETNLASIRVLEKNGFKRAGRLRKIHVVDGEARDRILFDLLADDHQSAMPGKTAYHRIST